MLSSEKESLIAAWRYEVCNQANEIDPEDEHDWHSLFVGFALGHGLSIEDATDYKFYEQYAYPLEREATGSEAPDEDEDDDGLGPLVVNEAGRPFRMCNDQSHPDHLLCCRPQGHTGRHLARFIASSSVVEW
jgi:hypothetical protein